MKPILILPDIHGRKFWQKPLTRHQDFSHIVFLGDYFDPYPQEGISEEDAIENFHQLSEALADIPADKVTMLTGNHDAHYISRVFLKLAKGTRWSSVHAKEIAELLKERVAGNIAWECVVNGRRYLFTHAGVGAAWLSKHKDIIGDATASSLNRLTETDEGWKALSDVGFMRGGWDEQGSPLWCDIRELLNGNKESDGQPLPYQIVGHTKLHVGKPYITDQVACLDTRMAYSLNEEGRLEQIK